MAPSRARRPGPPTEESLPEDLARPGRKAATLRWWVGGFAIGIGVVALLSVAAAITIAVVELRSDAKRNEHITDQLPAVAAAIESVAAPFDPAARAVPTGSCNGDTPARVSLFIATAPDESENLAAELVRRAGRAGWRPTSDPAAPDSQLERSFGGLDFNFQATPERSDRGGDDGVLVQSYFLGPEDC